MIIVGKKDEIKGMRNLCNAMTRIYRYMKCFRTNKDDVCVERRWWCVLN